MLERLDEGELVRAEDGGWLEELEVVHIMGLGEVTTQLGVWGKHSNMERERELVSA